MSGEISKRDAYRMASNIMLGIRSSSRLTSIVEGFSDDRHNPKCVNDDDPSAGNKMKICQGPTDPYKMKTKTCYWSLESSINKSANGLKNSCNKYNKPLACEVSVKESSNECILKKCPSCQEMNDVGCNWCLECGTAIVSSNGRSGNQLEMKSAPPADEIVVGSDCAVETLDRSILSGVNDLKIINLDDGGVDTYQDAFSRTSPSQCRTPVKAMSYSCDFSNEEKVGVVPATEDRVVCTVKTNIAGKIETTAPPYEIVSPFRWNFPEEIILRIFSNLSPSELSVCAQVCRQFNCIVSDNSLWKEIVLQNKSIDDGVLCKIARKHPSSLTISKCSTKNISKEGLHYLFYMCQQTLESLDFSNSCLGENVKVESLIQTCQLCHNIRSFDLSWTDVCDKAVAVICRISPALVDISINGCRRVTDAAIDMIVKNHSASLEMLRVFGCFHISGISIDMVSLKCKRLRVLNVGQCYKVSNNTINAVARGLPHLSSLDVRGCKKVTDSSLQELIRRCPLKSLVIANCPLVTNFTLDTLASSALQLTTFDISGIEKLTERSIENVIKSCSLLKSLDLSSTKATERCVFTISKVCASSLETLKLNFCRFITDSCLYAVVSSCKRLRMLLIYGCGVVRCLDDLLNANPHLDVRCDSGMRSLVTTPIKSHPIDPFYG